MSTNEKDQNLDDTLAELRESLKNIVLPESTTPHISEENMFGFEDTITLTSTPGTQPYANVTIGSSSGGGYTINSNGTGGGPASAIFTAGTGVNYANPMWANTSVTQDYSGSINLNGENADIKVKGYSLCEAIQRLEERLNILHINPELEKEWDELRELGDKYRALETKLKEQGKMWEKLKEMPPPKPLY